MKESDKVMKKGIIIIYGPPGSGKGTQANFLAERFGFVHFDTGKFLEALVNDPRYRDDPVIQKEKKNFDTGRLMTPLFVLKIVIREAEKLFQEGNGIVYSGSPRTLYEAFGDGNQPGLYEILEKMYGRDNIFIFHIDVKPETSIKRNSARGRARLDDPEVIKVRLGEYRERTEPILTELKKRAYNITNINGEPAPAEVNKDILRQLKF